MQCNLVESNNFIGSYEIELICPVLGSISGLFNGKIAIPYICFDKFLLNIL
jgi:hypothetical protein